MNKEKKIKNKFKNTFRVFLIILCISLIYYNIPNVKKLVFAESVDTKIDLNNDGNAEEVKFNNGELNISNSNGEIILKKVEDKTGYSSIAFIKDAKMQDTKILIQSKTKDTSSTLSYYIYKLEKSELIEVVHKEDIYKGVVKVQNNTEILEQTPIYDKDDSNAVPSYILNSSSNLEDNKLVLLKTEKLKYMSKSISLRTSEYYKNPSYDEIEKILTNVANEKGIPVEIFKAIAWQESKGEDLDNNSVTNWRQFDNGQPLISYDGVGIGIMQVSDFGDMSDAEIDRLKYDFEFNIRVGAEILIKKWELQNASVSEKIPKVGDASPNYLEHWYYAIWAYNSYGPTNNPLYNPIAYQTLVIKHVNDVFKKPMIDLYEYDPSLIVVDYPREDIAEISGKHDGELKGKDENYKYIVTVDTLNVRDDNMDYIRSYKRNDVVTIKGETTIKDIYVRNYIEGSGGSVVGYGLKPIGDVNYDGSVDIYDFVKQSKSINGVGTVIDDNNRISNEKFDVNMDGVVDISDIALTAANYNFSLYKNNIKN